MDCRYYMELSPELRPIVEAANRSSLLSRMVSALVRPKNQEGGMTGEIEGKKSLSLIDAGFRIVQVKMV